MHPLTMFHLGAASGSTKRGSWTWQRPFHWSTVMEFENIAQPIPHAMEKKFLELVLFFSFIKPSQIQSICNEKISIGKCKQRKGKKNKNAKEIEKENCKTIWRCCAALSGCLNNLNLSQTPLINLEGLYIHLKWRVSAAHELHKWFDLCLQASFPQRPLPPLLFDNFEPLKLPALLVVAPRLLPSLAHEAHQVLEYFLYIVSTWVSFMRLTRH